MKTEKLVKNIGTTVRLGVGKPLKRLEIIRRINEECDRYICEYRAERSAEYEGASEIILGYRDLLNEDT